MSNMPAGEGKRVAPGTVLEVLPAEESLEVLPILAADVTVSNAAAGVVLLPVEDVLPCSDETPPPLDLLPARQPVSQGEPWTFRRVASATWWGLTSGLEWLFGVITLIVGLAFLAAVPVIQFLSLGYLLEAGARVARSGRLRDGFPGVRKAARVGGVVLGTWLMLLPLRFLSSLQVSAQIIDPDGPVAGGWMIGLTVATVLMVAHIAAACLRGGKLRYFFWPFNLIWLARRLLRGGFYSEARDAVYDFVVSLRLPYYFWLGLRGFAGAFIWLAPPVTLLAIGRQAPVVGFIGGVLLAIVLMYVPFLQMRLAAENRFRAMFEFRTIRNRFTRAPWAFTLALFVTLLFALPLYLAKIEMIPREAAWIPSLFFIVFIFPARLLTGWALGRAERRTTPRHWFFRWTVRPLLLPMTGAYVLFAFFTQYAAWDGVWSLYEQHAFMLPVPFMGM